MCSNFAADVDRDVGDACDAAGSSDQRRAKARHLAFRRVTQFHIEGHVIALKAEVLDCLGGHEVASGIGIDDAFERVHDHLFCHCH